MANTSSDSKKLIRFDWFIKKMLRSKADFEILEGFLSELLKEDVIIEEIVESESNKNDKDDKFNRVDVLVKTSTDERIIIEIQNTKELDYLQRIFYGTSKTLVENIKEGFAYKKIKRVISISVVYFRLGVGKDYIYYGETSFRGLHNSDDILSLSQEQLDFFANPKIKKVEDIFARYYLICTDDFSDIVNDSLDEWVYFFKNAVVRGSFPAKGLQKAKERLRVADLEGKELKDYNKYIELMMSDASYEEQFKFELAREVEKVLASEVEKVLASEVEKVLASEVEKALDLREVSLAENLLKKGMSIDDIVEVTNLTSDQIQKIKEKMLK